MDIYCPVCGEPWDMDELHDTNMSFRQARIKFYQLGCEVFGTSHNKTSNNDAAELAGIVYDLFGDDLDGAAAELEDWLA